MLSNLLKDHQKKCLEQKDIIKRKKEDAFKAANEFGSAIIEYLNNDVSQAYLNQHKINSEVRKLQTNVNLLVKQANQWLNLMDSLNVTVKELGDVENSTKSIENDLRLVSSTLEYVYKVGNQS